MNKIITKKSTSIHISLIIFLLFTISFCDLMFKAPGFDKIEKQLQNEKSDSGNNGDDSSDCIDNVDSTTQITDLVAYYPFSGNAVDETGNLSNGQLFSTNLSEDRFGNADSAFEFNGANSEIVINHDDLLNSSADGLSFSFWLKVPNPNNKWITIISKYESAVSWKVQLHDQNSAINFYYENSLGDDQDFPGSKSLADNLWHHIVVNYNGSDNWTIYVDNISAVDAPLGDLDNNGNIFLGSSEEYGEFFSGSIDDVYFFNRALSVAEIQTLYEENCWTGN